MRIGAAQKKKTVELDNKKVSGYKTAISRKAISAPLSYLMGKNNEGINYLGKKMRILDYGCGRGFDFNYLKLKGYKAYGYDPHYLKETLLTMESFDLIYCNYVLNVVAYQEEKKIISHIKSLLKPNGKAYIAVRRDLKTDTIGRDCVQRVVKCPKGFTIVAENSTFAIFEFVKS